MYSIFLNINIKVLVGVCTNSIQRLLINALWVIRVILVHMTEYYMLQLLSSGGICFCRLVNKRSLTHAVENLFLSEPGREKKDFPGRRLVMQSDMSGGYVITE